MNSPSPSMRQLAMRLLEASRSASLDARAGDAGSTQHTPQVVAMCETLRVWLTKFAGEDGTAALMRRAISLAASEAPALQRVRLGANCEMDGLAEVAAAKGGADAAVALTAHLLDLLVMFIGESLTLQLLREGWPDLELIQSNAKGTAP